MLLLRGREHGREARVELHVEIVVFIHPQRGGEAQLVGQKPPAGLSEAAGFGVGQVVGERVLAGLGIDKVIAVGHHHVGAVVETGQQVHVGGQGSAAAAQGLGQVHLDFAVQQVGAHAQGRAPVPVVDVLQLAQALVEGRGAGLQAAGVGGEAGAGVGLGQGLAGSGGGVPGAGVVGVPAGVGLEAAVQVFAHRTQVVALAGVFAVEVGAGLHHGRGEGKGVLLEAVILQPEAVRALVHVVKTGHAVGVGQFGAGPEAVVQRGVGLEHV